MIKKITVIIGPTAAGKSDYAIKLAQKTNGEIISADAYQIYRGMNIGTAKVPLSERYSIPHHLVSTKDPKSPYNVTLFLEETTKIIKKLKEQNKKIIICGGTGLYIKSLLYNYQFPQKSPPLKPPSKRLLTNKEEWDLLNQIDPQTAHKIPYQNTRRVKRALAIFNETGQKPSEAKQKTETIRNDIELIGLNYPRPILIQRINQRIDQMIQNGLIEEVQQLLDDGVPQNAQSLQAIGYKEIIEYLTKKYTKENAIEKIKIKTRQFAKRQMTWFNTFPNVKWIYQNDT